LDVFGWLETNSKGEVGDGGDGSTVFLDIPISDALNGRPLTARTAAVLSSTDISEN
jgi:hypothetical protein